MIFVVCFGPWLRALFEWRLSTNQISRILESWPLIGCWDFWFTSWRVLWSRQSASPWSLAPRRPRRRWRRAGWRWTPWTPRGPSVTERGDVEHKNESKNNTQKTQELLGPPEKNPKTHPHGEESETNEEVRRPVDDDCNRGCGWSTCKIHGDKYGQIFLSPYMMTNMAR